MGFIEFVEMAYAIIFGMLGLFLTGTAVFRWKSSSTFQTERYSYLQMAVGVVLMLLALFVMNW